MLIPTPGNVRRIKEGKISKERLWIRVKARVYLVEILIKMRLGQEDITLFFNAGKGGDFYTEVVAYLREKLKDKGWNVDYEFKGFGSENARVDVQIRPDH